MDGNTRVKNTQLCSHPHWLPFRVAPFYDDRLGTRHVVEHRETGKPAVAASLYEIHLAQQHDSHNTRQAKLRHLAYLYSWGEESGRDIDNALLTGAVFSFPDIRSFAAWLRTRWPAPGGILSRANRRTFNAIVDGCRQASLWFVRQFTSCDYNVSDCIAYLSQKTEMQRTAWKEVRFRTPYDPAAADLTDGEIEAIETYLNPAKRTQSDKTIAIRDYLIWRMAIEFGMRRSEILAMRVSDCPTRNAPYFRIIRIEERGPDYYDPRRERAPRPKTLSHDVGLVLSNTRFPRLVGDYITAHRYRAVSRHRRRIRVFLLDHPFLLVSRTGAPLSQSYMSRLAEEISQKTGVDFHWHLARHAFFNRAYAAVAEIMDANQRQVRLGDLLYFGGWANPESINIYVKNARNKRAQSALMLWQEGGNTWTALN